MRRVIKLSLYDSALGFIRELDALFDQSPIAMVFNDRELRIKCTNAAFRRLAGLPDEGGLPPGHHRPGAGGHGSPAGQCPARGLSNAAIARSLAIGETTAKTHVTRILTKLRLRDRAHAVVYGYETGLVRPGEGGAQQAWPSGTS